MKNHRKAKKVSKDQGYKLKEDGRSSSLTSSNLKHFHASKVSGRCDRGTCLNSGLRQFALLLLVSLRLIVKFGKRRLLCIKCWGASKCDRSVFLDEGFCFLRLKSVCFPLTFSVWDWAHWPQIHFFITFMSIFTKGGSNYRADRRIQTEL